MNKAGWIGVDLDGTLARFDQWVGVHHIGEPVPSMVARVQKWLKDGYEVRIFTARVSGRDMREAARARGAIVEWSVRHIGHPLPVTCVKDFDMLRLYDDRCVQVEPNTGVLVGGDDEWPR